MMTIKVKKYILTKLMTIFILIFEMMTVFILFLKCDDYIYEAFRSYFNLSYKILY